MTVVRARQPKAAFVWTAFLASLTLGVHVGHAQVIADPNQIEGRIRFTNQDPDILSILESSGDAEGIRNVHIQAESVPTATHPDVLYASATVGATSAERTDVGYQIAVQSGPAGDGIPYNMFMRANLDFEGDSYSFKRQVSDPVEREPAPNVRLDVEECAGMLDIRWVDSSGDPVPVTGGSIRAIRWDPAIGDLERAAQAWDSSITPGLTQTFLAVRGGEGSTERYGVVIIFEVGEDDFWDRRRLLCNEAVQYIDVACDEVVTIVCENAGCEDGGSGNGLALVRGEVDMLGEFEHALETRSLMRAADGPLGNFRLDTVDGTLFSTPSSGPFELPNLVDSSASIPLLGRPMGYWIFGELLFRTGNEYTVFRTPGYGPVMVSPGEIIDLGGNCASEDDPGVFCMEPGYQRGSVLLAGPPATAASCFEALKLVTDVDSDGDGLLRGNLVALPPAVSHVEGLGPTSAAARAGIGGDLVGSDFAGRYELTMAGLSRGSSTWTSNSLSLSFFNFSLDPTLYRRGVVRVVNETVGEHTVVPGGTSELDHIYCFSQITIDFTTTEGEFVAPMIWVMGTGGRFVGTDFRGLAADYRVAQGYAGGTPAGDALASDTGSVVLCLPQATYPVIAPEVRFVQPDGSYSLTGLESFGLQVGCRQTQNVVPGLMVNMATLPSCSATPTIQVDGTVGENKEISRVFHVINDGAPVAHCDACGIDPSFSFEAQLRECSNSIVVTAVDNEGREASTTGYVTYDPSSSPPALECPERLVAVATEDGVASVEDLPLPTEAEDNCDGTVPVLCDAPRLLPVGTTDVTCRSVDHCGHQSECSITVEVRECDAPRLTCAADARQCNDSGSCQATVTYELPEAQGGCGEVSVTCDSPSGAVYPVGTTTVTCLAVDEVGQEGSCSLDIEVSDCEAPSLSLGGVPSCTVDEVCVEAFAWDNCAVSRVDFEDEGTVFESDLVAPYQGCVGEHGDHDVAARACDLSANCAEAITSFTIDLVLPDVALLEPVEQPYPAWPAPFDAYRYPDDLPICVSFASEDDDGARGGVELERVLIDRVPLFWGYGPGDTDSDGLLSDESSLCFDEDLLCGMGMSLLGDHVVQAEAIDCAGNIGSDAAAFDVILMLTDGSVVVKPESARSNGGRLTTVVCKAAFDAGCEVARCSSDVVDSESWLSHALEPGTSVRPEAVNDRNRAMFILKTRRSELGGTPPGPADPMGTAFGVSGSLTCGDVPVRFGGTDDVFKNPPTYDGTGERPPDSPGACR